jgi:Cu/Ag efflux pump CusA
VADVVSFGGLIKTYEIQPDVMKMRDYKHHHRELAQALGRSNSPTRAAATSNRDRSSS